MNTDRTKQQPAIIIILIVIIITPNSPNDFGKQSGRIIVVGSLGPRPECRRDPFAQYQSAGGSVAPNNRARVALRVGKSVQVWKFQYPIEKLKPIEKIQHPKQKKERILRSEESSECEKRRKALPSECDRGGKKRSCVVVQLSQQQPVVITHKREPAEHQRRHHRWEK